MHLTAFKNNIDASVTHFSVTDLMKPDLVCELVILDLPQVDLENFRVEYARPRSGGKICSAAKRPFLRRKTIAIRGGIFNSLVPAGFFFFSKKNPRSILFSLESLVPLSHVSPLFMNYYSEPALNDRAHGWFRFTISQAAITLSPCKELIRQIINKKRSSESRSSLLLLVWTKSFIVIQQSILQPEQFEISRENSVQSAGWSVKGQTHIPAGQKFDFEKRPRLS